MKTVKQIKEELNKYDDNDRVLLFRGKKPSIHIVSKDKNNNYNFKASIDV